jgi:hypothetical protein
VGPAGPTTPVASGTASAASISAALLAALKPAGRGAKLAAIVKARAYRTSFAAPSSGRVTIVWSLKSAVMASVTRTVTSPGRVSLQVKLTTKGKALFAKAKRARKTVKLTAKGTFVPSGGTKVARTLAIALKP